MQIQKSLNDLSEGEKMMVSIIRKGGFGILLKCILEDSINREELANILYHVDEEEAMKEWIDIILTKEDALEFFKYTIKTEGWDKDLDDFKVMVKNLNEET